MVTDVQITAGTATEVVTLAKAKKHLRIEASFVDEDDLIQDYIDAAVVMAEDYISGHIADKNMIIKSTGFENPLVFEVFPVKSITSITYFEEGFEDEKTLDASEYVLNSETLKRFAIRYKNTLPNVQDRFDAVTVTINIGMETIAKPIAQAVMLIVADMYERREDRVETLSTASKSLLRPYKKF